MKIKDAYEELKAMTDPDEYISIAYDITRNSYGVEESECTIYIGDRGIFMANSFKGVLDQVRADLGLNKPDNPDEVDINN